MKVTVLRAFLFNGKATEVGKVIDLPDRFALEMLHVGKVERVPVDAPDTPDEPAAKPKAKRTMTTKTAGELVAGASQEQEPTP